MTYQELYVQHLERALEAGGKQEVVDKVIAEFNVPTLTGFSAWLETQPWITCSTCGEPFKPKDAVPPQEILCQAHVLPTPSPTTVH